MIPEEKLREAAALIDSAKHPLLITHLRPDGDALGSSFGLCFALRNRGKMADVFVPSELPHRHTKLFQGALRSMTREELDSYDAVISLDCANPERLGKPDCIEFQELKQRTFWNFDHHAGNSLAADYNLVAPECSSASELAVTIALAAKWEIPQTAATAWLSGMMTDTGSFRFANTTPATMRTAAELIERGAELEKIVNALFFSKPLNQTRFENELMTEHMKLICDNKAAYAVIPQTLLDKYNFSLKEDEGLIDLLREIDGVIVAMLIHKGSDGWKISLRSKDQRYPVGPLARSLGGGGHNLAAGATLAFDVDPEKLMVEKITALLLAPISSD